MVFSETFFESDYIKGQLDVIIQNIDLFNNFFKKNEYVKYSSVKQQLDIELHTPFTDLNILNELLKHPIYEIRKINLETLQNLIQEQSI